MLIGILSDTHLPRGERRLPDGCVERLRGCDLVLHAGDFTAASVLEQIEAIGPPLAAVHGNVDCSELKRCLPETRTVDAEGVRIVMVHDGGSAAGRLERLRRRFPAAAAVVFGHSHLPLHQRSDGFQIFNPGSPTERRRAPAHTMGIARVEGGWVSFEHLQVG